MAKSFHEFSTKAQIATFAILSVFTVGAGWQMILGPQRADVETHRASLATLETELTRAQGVAKRLPQARQDVKALEASLRETESVIPEEKDPQDVLRNLNEIAGDSLLYISGFKPKPAASKAQYTEWPIELQMEGTYHDLGRFFDRIASMQRLMSVSDLQIRTKQKTGGRGSVAVSCVATTFVFKKDSSSSSGDQP
jgi:type IV pilus assembly protein PilO